MDSLGFIIFIIIIALVFDFTNGMHDAANSISTIVSTRVLTPRQAVVWAAFFNFIAFLVFGTTVAKTIGKEGFHELAGAVERIVGRKKASAASEKQAEDREAKIPAEPDDTEK